MIRPTLAASRLFAVTSPCVENVKELPAWSSCLRLTIVKLDPGKEKSGEILFNHLETAQSEAKASPRKPKVVSLCKSENWGCKPLSTKPSMKLKIVHIEMRLYVPQRSCSSCVAAPWQAPRTQPVTLPHASYVNSKKCYQGRCNSNSIVFDSNFG